MSSTRNEIDNSSEQELSQKSKQKLKSRDLPSPLRSGNIFSPKELPIHIESPTNKPQPASEYVDFPHRKF